MTDITCADIADCVVKEMRARNSVARPGIKYMQCDARDMQCFSDASFDIVFDKSTMDALKCAGRSSTRSCSTEVHRVLKDGGLYLCVSFTDPDQMVSCIEDTLYSGCDWQIQVLSCESQVNATG